MRLKVLGLALLMGSASWAKGGELERWREIDVPRAVRAHFLTIDGCYSSALYLRSCYNAVARAADLLNAPTAFPMPTELPDPAATTERVDFEALLQNLSTQLPKDVPESLFWVRAIEGHLKTFDENAHILPSQVRAENESQDHLAYTGIGLLLEEVDGRKLVTEVIPNSAAERSGLIGDEEILELTARDSQRVFVRWRGRDGERSALLSKSDLQWPVVSHRVLDGGTGYLRVRSFLPDNTCSLVREHLAELQSLNIQNLILDLRGNGGGQRRAATCVTSLFTGLGPVVGVETFTRGIPSLETLFPARVSWRQPAQSPHILLHRGVMPRQTSVPMVVLIDEETASAAEVTAAALRDPKHRRAFLVGTRSFGKASSQSLRTLPGAEALTLAITTERLFAPSGSTHHGVGLAPSFEVPSRAGRKLATSARELDPRADEATPIRTCVESKALDQQMLKIVSAQGRADYQLAWAMAVLRCQ